MEKLDLDIVDKLNSNSYIGNFAGNHYGKYCKEDISLLPGDIKILFESFIQLLMFKKVIYKKTINERSLSYSGINENVRGLFLAYLIYEKGIKLYERSDDFSSCEASKYCSTDFTSNNINITKLYFNDMDEVPVLTSKEEIYLANAIKRGDEAAFNELIISNLRLVVSIAKKYAGKKIDFIDLIQEGNLGLIEAALRFDLSHGCKFSTYATIWIEKYITMAFTDKARIIRIPAYVQNELNKYLAIYSNLELKLLRQPSSKEIAQEMGVDEKRVEFYEKYRIEPLYLGYVYEDDNENFLYNFIHSNEGIPENVCFGNEVRANLIKILETLPERERCIIEYRYGFVDDVCWTLEKIGEKFGLSPERIRQIEKKTLDKIRKSRNFLSLFDGYGGIENDNSRVRFRK